MKPHEARVVDEKAALDEKIQRLVDFTATRPFKELPYADQKLLMSQCSTMRAYSLILEMRIDRFPKESEELVTLGSVSKDTK